MKEVIIHSWKPIKIFLRGIDDVDEIVTTWKTTREKDKRS